jgi:hypothetical protein
VEFEDFTHRRKKFIGGQTYSFCDRRKYFS